MSSKPNALPAGYHSISPYLILKDAASAIEFYKQVFGASELMRLADGSGRVRHAEIAIGGSEIMLADEPQGFPALRSPQPLGGSAIQIHIYTEDADAIFSRALAAGASVLMPLEDQGEDRRGGLIDPFGHVWWIATRIEDITREGIQERFEASLKT